MLIKTTLKIGQISFRIFADKNLRNLSMFVPRLKSQQHKHLMKISFSWFFHHLLLFVFFHRWVQRRTSVLIFFPLPRPKSLYIVVQTRLPHRSTSMQYFPLYSGNFQWKMTGKKLVGSETHRKSHSIQVSFSIYQCAERFASISFVWIVGISIVSSLDENLIRKSKKKNQKSINK